MKIAKSRKIYKIAAWTMALVLACIILLSGCSVVLEIKVTGILFDDSASWTLSLGEEKEFGGDDVKFQPTMATNKTFTLTSSDDSVIGINPAQNRITATGVGTAELIVTSVDGNFTAEKTVQVNYAAVKKVTIGYDLKAYTVAGGKIIFSDSENNPLTLTSDIGKYADPATKVNWEVTRNGQSQKKEIKKSEESFTYSPSSIGAYRATASVGSSQAFTDALDFNVCAPITDASMIFNGNLTQEQHFYRAVTFLIEYTNPEENPEPIIEWFLNDEWVSHNETYEFLPKHAGLYEISVRINGREVDRKRLVAKGSVTPKNVAVDFDNCFPDVFVRWDTVPPKVGYEVEIINNTTGLPLAENLTSRLPALANKFTPSGFDASQYFMGEQVNLFNTTFTVRVRTLGDGEVFTDSAWSAVFMTKILPSSAKPFLLKKYYDGGRNYYIADEDEFYDFYTYRMIYRTMGSDAYGASAENFDVLYMGYPYGNTDEAAKQLMDNAFTYSAITGLFASEFSRLKDLSKIGVSLEPNQLSVHVTFYSVGLPEKRTRGNTPGGHNAMRPHLNTDPDKRRAAFTALPIDHKREVTVATSEQLYTVAERGYKPVPTVGSDAETLYNYARRVLFNIIGTDMTDIDKAHAVYDWILWRVTYDEAVLSVHGTIDERIDGGIDDSGNPISQAAKQMRADIREAVKYEAYYLESVFTNTDFYAVCDAMSKAYSLLCNIEGIACLRVSGSVPGGGHAWNKVYLDDNWYVVDCTWGDFKTKLNGDEKESASHAYFMLTDSEIKSDHFQGKSNRYPSTAAEPYNWYDQEVAFGDKTVDFYFDNVSTVKKEAKLLVEYMLTQASGKSQSYTVGPDSGAKYNTTTSPYYGFDIRINSILASRFTLNTLMNPLIEAFKTGFNKTLNQDYFLSRVDINVDMYLFVYIRL